MNTNEKRADDVPVERSSDVDTGSIEVQEEKKQPDTAARKAASKLRIFLWGHPPESKAERRLLMKIDFFVMSFLMLMYWSNYLNRTNLTSAYVSGMKEELHFRGNQFNQVNTVFTVGYIIGQIPNNLALQVVPARIWLPSMALIWAGLSMCLAAAKNPGQIMAIRFFQALAEASTFSGTHYLLGSWYKEEELGKRSGIFASSAQLGSLFSGVLQGSIYRSMEGYRGLRAFQWLFLLDGFIALPIALYGFLCFPDAPQTTHAWFLTDAERKLAVTRLPPRPHTKLEWNLVRRVLGRWHWYAFSALFAWSSMLESVGINGLFQLWIASEDSSIQHRNYYPLALTAVAIVSTIVCAHVTDFYRCRWPVNFVMAGGCVISAILILIWNIPFGARFFAFALAGVGYAGQGSNFAWANDVTRDDEQERAMVLASMNLFSNVINSWWSLVFYRATDAPRFRKGMIALICVAVATVIITLATRHLDMRDRKRRGEYANSDERESASPCHHVTEAQARRGNTNEEDDTISHLHPQ
ncbi:hypothetical protein A4X13_0g2659 [Tilletia indica]|uniref:Major facilitator superfamily (MFS) profile domain-containing protein n=1 Tax=Tilletia indica TaxID=43049 RepID=A0A177TAP9_9BASI|nr:hypothetical protein A4X13_0g2659 [Tilletia indica]